LSSRVEARQIAGAGAECFSSGTEAGCACSDSQASEAMRSLRSISRPLSGEESTRLAVLSIFSDPVPEQCSRLIELSAKEWNRLLRWLDLSGLALYFVDRVVELKLCDLLPTAVFTRLHLNLIDNNERTLAMLRESMEIQNNFQQAGISYAVLKGISLWPDAVSKPELRLQFDLDYLVAENDMAQARAILERSRYRLYAVSGRSWEFKKNERPGVSLKDIYKHFDSYGVELHSSTGKQGELGILDRVQWRDVNGMTMPVLDPVDLFLGHGLHTFKNVCSEYARASHFLEFRRHVLRYRDDSDFWHELRQLAEGDRRACLGLGLVLYLINHVMGESTPEALASWTVDRLPNCLRLWVQAYGYRVMLGSYPGTKLYLLLQQELEKCGIAGKRSPRAILVPGQLPPPVIRPFANERLNTRVRRYVMHLGTILERTRFHVVEGIRYATEARRWHRLRGSPL
jgi:hypothetical protein